MPSDVADRPREARLWEIVFPDHANHLGTPFGGQALAWMDKAAFVAATRFSRRTVVTARSEQVDFHVSVRQGQRIELVATVEAVGRSAIQVVVALHAEDALAGSRRLCTRGRFTMVALDGEGQPVPVVV